MIVCTTKPRPKKYKSDDEHRKALRDVIADYALDEAELRTDLDEQITSAIKRQITENMEHDDAHRYGWAMDEISIHLKAHQRYLTSAVRKRVRAEMALARLEQSE